MKNEHLENLTEAEHVRHMIDSTGWNSVYPKLSARILDIQNINNLADVTDPQQLLIEIKARKLAADTMYAWLKQDVYGFVEQQTIATNKEDEPRTYVAGI